MEVVELSGGRYTLVMGSTVELRLVKNVLKHSASRVGIGNKIWKVSRELDEIFKQALSKQVREES